MTAPAANGAPAPYVFSGRHRLPVEAACSFEAPSGLPALADLPAAVAEALDAPPDAPPLSVLARDARSVAVVVPDASRGCPVAALLPAVLERLARAGVGDDRIAVVVGCGLHRTTTAAEKAALVGPAVAARLRVVDAQGISQGSVALGVTTGGGEICMNDVVAGATLVIALGIVEPHLYAGFSGGVKAVAIGCAGQRTIAWTHDPAFLDQPAVSLCRLEGNPFQQALREIAASTTLRFALNVVVNAQGEVAAVAGGDPAGAQARLVRGQDGAWVRRHEQPFDLVIAGVPTPKDRSLYQASRAATYVGMAARPAIADGGLIACCADLALGVGDGPGEINFGALLAAERPLDLVARGRVEPLGPGGQRAYMMAKLLTRYRVALVGAGDRALIESMGLLAFRTIGEAVAAARRAHGPAARVLAVADGLDTIVELASS
jgi:lactate racemase